MKEITSKVADQEFGVRTAHHKMANGETRFRLIDGNGIGYVRTQAGIVGSWQNSHFHLAHSETYIVQKKWVVIATLSAQQSMELLKLEEGHVWTSAPNLAHNVFMSGGSITHTVKHGKGSRDDWFTNQETDLLDQKSQSLTEQFLEAVDRKIVQVRTAPTRPHPS
jgi:hypothetical protein